MNDNEPVQDSSQLRFDSSLNEYSDLLAESVTSFLNQAEQQSTTINLSHQPIPSSLSSIDLNSTMSLPFNRFKPLTSTSSVRSDSINPLSNLMDHSISSFELHSNPLGSSSRTPSHSPAPIIKKVLSTPAAIAAMSPLASRTHSTLTTLTRTRSTDLLHSPPRSTSSSVFPRSKSSTAIRSSLSHHPALDSNQSDPIPIIKSILRRPNSPSKGSRARFFSPRVLVQVDDQVGNESDLVDDQGHFRAREVVHEFEVDAPPSSCISSKVNLQTQSPRHQSSTTTTTNSIRKQHIPRFTIPEPAELDIEPILPRLSTSPSPSPPSLPSTIFSNKSQTGVNKGDGSTSILNSSTSIFGSENLSNIMEESGGFLGDDTTWGAFEHSQNTERSIDLNHVAMMEVLGNKSSSLGKRSLLSSKRPSTVSQFETLQETEEEASVDMIELMRKMNGAHERSMDQALRDEPVPENILQISQDFSTTFEMSRMIPLNLPPLPTNQESSIPNGNCNRASNITSPIRNMPPKGITTHPPFTPTSALARLNLVQQLKKDIPASPSRSPKKKASTTPSRTPVDENKKTGILELINTRQPDLITPQVTSKGMISKRVSISIPTTEIKKRDFGNRINESSSTRQNSEFIPPSSAPATITKTSVPKRIRPSSTITLTKREIDSSLMPPPSLPLKKRVSLVPAGKTSGIGLGLPSSANSATYATSRIKAKPSNVLLPRGSPKVMKPRSSISSASISNQSPLRKVLQSRPSALSRPRSLITTTMINKMDGNVKVESSRPNLIKKPLSNSSTSSKKVIMIRPSISSTDLNSLRKPNMMIKGSNSSNELSQQKTSMIGLGIKTSCSSNELNHQKTSMVGLGIQNSCSSNNLIGFGIKNQLGSKPTISSSNCLIKKTSELDNHKPIGIELIKTNRTVGSLNKKSELNSLEIYSKRN